MSTLKYHLLALLATLLIAGSFLSAAKLSGVINPISLTLLRFMIAATVLMPVILLQSKYRGGIRKALPPSLIMSLFFTGFFICMFEALKTTTALNTGTLYTLVPFMTALVSLLVFKEKISSKMLLVYLIGVAGTCWVIFGGDINALLALSLNGGDALFLAGCLSMVSFSISMKLLYRGGDIIVTVFCTLFGGVFWMALALMLFNQPIEWHVLNANDLLHMGYLALFTTLGSTFLIQKSTVVLGPARVSAYIYLSPVFVALLMLMVEGKSIPTIVLPGMALSITATILLQLQHRRQNRPPQSQ